MVLKRALLVAGFFAIACIPKRAPVRAKTAMTVAVAGVVDRNDTAEVGALPEAAAKRIASVLAERNLKPRMIAADGLTTAFGAKRTTAHRLAALGEGADADLLVLIETSARFYSQLSGRYRWDVDARVTIAKKGALEQAASSSIQVAAFVDFDHERETEALVVAAPRIADEVGRLADEFLGGLPAAERRRWLASAGDATDAIRTTKKPADSIYFVMVDRFANGDPSNDGVVDPGDPQAFHGGDLAGVLAHLDDLQDLGVRTVWLSPIFKMRTEKFHGFGAYHGYWVEDFDRVEPRFGSTELLAKLSKELHARGMRLVLDVVLNHVGPDTPLVKQHPDWFHHDGPIRDWNDASQLVTREVYGLPDLAQENPAVYDFLLARSLSWIERVHPDGFRLDAARHIGLPFWKRYVADLHAKAGRDFAMLGEMYDGNATTLAKTQTDAGFDSVFDFPLYFAMKDVFCDDAPPSRLAATLFADREYADPSRLVTFVDNHDLPRVLSACHDDPERVRQALTFLLTARGIPSLLWGTESGLAGAKEPENRADMRFDRAAAPRATIRSLLAARNGSDALRAGSTRILALDETLFVCARVAAGSAVVVAVNRAPTKRLLELPPELVAGKFRDALTGQAVELPLAIDPRGIRVLSVERGTLYAPAGTRRVEFRVRRAVPEDAALVLAGSGPELGGWDPAKGLVLRRGRYGEFEGSITLPVGSAWEWKLVVRPPAGAPTWEPGPNRPLLVVAGSGPLRITPATRVPTDESVPQGTSPDRGETPQPLASPRE